ncbi:linear gramicidin synthetase subunit D domain protein [Mycobacterium xenopi 4042]|uniref:Linear gramicidin synthetase subunit D domain protein n=1 Tax=Mycobacterium xenopi 4042 TaxID=1299334 RepID=X8BJN0_MYCXE|nr:linear gramicidin synthetase subunit D domain protein [Mycobacterium xenopi 4042]
MDMTFSLASAGARRVSLRDWRAVEFRTDVFDAASVEALIERFRRVLTALTADPTRRLSSVDLLDDAEHARLDVLGNRAVGRPTPRRRRFRRCSPPGHSQPGGSGAEVRRAVVELPGS